MATNAALNATVQDLLQRTTAAEALGAQLLQQHAASAAQIAEQAGMLGQLEQDNAALVAQLADNTTSQVAQAALNAIPAMSEKMASKMAAIKDSYVTSREVWDILSRTQPDINKARSLIGRIVRLSGAALTGAELSAQSIKGQYHEFSESYYKAARPLAYKTPEQADWSPDQHLLPVGFPRRGELPRHGGLLRALRQPRRPLPAGQLLPGGGDGAAAVPGVRGNGAAVGAGDGLHVDGGLLRPAG